MGAAATGAVSIFEAAASSAVQDAGKPKPRVLALIGDRYHSADYIRVSLDRLFSELDLPIDYTIMYDQLSRDRLRGYGILLCLRDGMIWPGGYLGPDAYACYEDGLENPGDLSKAKTTELDYTRAGRGCPGVCRRGQRSLLLTQQQSRFTYFSDVPGSHGRSVHRSSAVAALQGASR